MSFLNLVRSMTNNSSNFSFIPEEETELFMSCPTNTRSERKSTLETLEKKTRATRIEDSEMRSISTHENFSLLLQQIDETNNRLTSRTETDFETTIGRRLEMYKTKSQRDQSAVASPEVKRHLAEFVLKKKKRSSVSSMTNLKMIPKHSSFSSLHPTLRKTASESNLLKMKSKRETRTVSFPYQRVMAPPCKNPPSTLRSHSEFFPSDRIPRSLPSLETSEGYNSKSLPNIPNALVSSQRHCKERTSPPSTRFPISHCVRKSKSSALLPLRKHIMEKARCEGDSYILSSPHSLIRSIAEVKEDTSSGGAELSSSDVTRVSDTTGLGYDPIMLKHECLCSNSDLHPENPHRILCIWNRLLDSGLAASCAQVSRSASLEEIQSVHSESHTIIYGSDMLSRMTTSCSSSSLHSKFVRLECGGLGVDFDTYWNENHTANAIRASVGTLIELSNKVLIGELKNGYAIIRPPGHHAEHEEAMGFCYFNSVSIAAQQLLRHSSVNKILIIDWAIHHGNGTQKIFYDTPNVLYMSLHRHDNGNFYPGTGSSIECGRNLGLGYNVNIAWSGDLEPPMGDAEYLAAFRSIILPIARSYEPDFVLVSAGFDAGKGHEHPIGGYLVSTACFAFLTHQLQSLARGKVVLALEGGFNYKVLSEASEMCVRALQGLSIEKISESELGRRPNYHACETLQKTLAIQTPYWTVLKSSFKTAFLSHLEAWEREQEDFEALHGMKSLSVRPRLNNGS